MDPRAQLGERQPLLSLAYLYCVCRQPILLGRVTVGTGAVASLMAGGAAARIRGRHASLNCLGWRWRTSYSWQRTASW